MRDENPGLEIQPKIRFKIGVMKKLIPVVLFSIAVAFCFTGCETTSAPDATNYPDPNPSRTAQDVQQMHSQIQRGNF